MTDEPMRNSEGKSEDDLWASLDGQVGSARVSTLLELSDLICLGGDLERGLSLADAALETALEVDNDLLTGRAHSQRGATLFALDRFEESAAAHLDAARLFERFDSLDQVSAAYCSASWSLEMAGLLERSLQCADSAISAAQQSGDDPSMAAAQWQRADTLTKLGGRDDEVLQALSSARQAFRAAKDVQGVLRADNRVADIFADSGDFKAAVSLLSDCLAVAGSLDALQASYFAFRLGTMQRRQGLYAEAMETLQQPLAYNLEQQNLQPLASIWFEMAICQWRLGQEDEAFRTMAKARAHFDIVGSDEMLLECDEFRAIWLHGVGRYHEAMDLNRHLMEITTGERHFMARARLADNHRCHGDLAEALEFSTPTPDEDRSLVNTSDWLWRECVRATTLERMDRADEAHAIAIACLDDDISAASAFVQARLHELRGDSLLGDDEDAAHADWARAVALYLVADLPKEAKRLSSEFLRKAEGEDVQ